MLRSYLLFFIWLFGCATPLYGMLPAPVALPITTALDVIKNDIASGGIFLIPALQATVPVGAIALLKMLYHGGFSFSQLCEGMASSEVLGPCLLIFIGYNLGGIVYSGTGTASYNENDFVNSENAFKVRKGLRYSLALLYSFLTFEFLQEVLAREPEDFFYEHPSLMVFR